MTLHSSYLDQYKLSLELQHFLSSLHVSEPSSLCSYIGENVTSFLAKFEDENFVSLPLLSLSVDPKLTSDGLLPIFSDKSLLTEACLPGKVDNEERTPVNTIILAA